MTKRECAIITAFTGIVMLQGNDLDIFYAYVEELLGRPLFTHEYADKEMWEKLKELSKPDFINICREANDD